MAAYTRQLIDSLRSDPLIDEIGLLLDIAPPVILRNTEDDDGGFEISKGDVSVTVVAEHKLGVAAWALKPIFLHSMPMFMELLADLRRKHPGFLTTDSLRNGDVTAIVEKAIGLSSAILIVKGDIPIVHNFRKLLLEAGALNFAEELVFLSMLFTRHPKSPSAWEHRRWCLRKMAMLSEILPKNAYQNENCTYPCSSWASDSTPFLSPEGVGAEAALCTRSAEAYPRNYYAWMHRLWLLRHMSDDQVTARPDLFDSL
jgi:protein prenyltransferase alpha subunit repeat containing protein 1